MGFGEDSLLEARMLFTTGEDCEAATSFKDKHPNKTPKSFIADVGCCLGSRDKRPTQTSYLISKAAIQNKITEMGFTL